MKTELIIIRGTPAAGKSSLGRRLKKLFPDGAFIEVDNVRGMMNNVDWVSEKEHLTALHVVAANTKAFLDSNITVIVADMFMPDKLQLFFESVQGIKYKVISLIVNDIVLAKRFADRKEGFRDLEKGIQLNRIIQEGPCENELIIDTSEITKNEISETSYKFLGI